jgi:predicted permease
MSPSQYIIAVLFILQIMGLGLVMGKMGEPKTGIYKAGDLVIGIIISTMLVYVFWEMSK